MARPVRLSPRAGLSFSALLISAIHGCFVGCVTLQALHAVHMQRDKPLKNPRDYGDRPENDEVR
jgi:hypothetical protein